MHAIQDLELNRQFGIPGVAQIVEGSGGLPKVHVKSPSVEGDIYLHGAHLASWKPAGAEEVIFMSRQSQFEDGRPIRGGTPICFPWFGPNAANPKAPAHGFARLRAWQLDSIEQDGDAVTVTMSLASDESTKQWWPADFRLTHRLTFAQELTMELVLENTGDNPARFEEAMHTYYRIGDMSKTRISGLDGVHYLDKTDSGHEKIQLGDIVVLAETDRVYLNTIAEIEIVDPVLRRRIRVAKENSHTTVVWNPWLAKAQSLADLGPTAWPNMVCVEVSNVNAFAVLVPPGKRHTMKAISRVSAL
jgi:glucose-6-phosphate 1-epimerase